MIKTSNNLKVESKFADESGQIMLVKLSGYLDQSNSSVLENLIDDIYTSECYNVIFDFSNVSYISSAGWGVFVGEIARFRLVGGDFKFIHMSPEVYDVFMMLEFYHIFEDYETVDLAVKSFNGLNTNDSDLKKTTDRKRKLKIPDDQSESVKNENNAEFGNNELDTTTKRKRNVQNKRQNEQKLKEKKISFKLKRVSDKNDKTKISGNPADDLILIPRKVLPLEQLPTYEKIKMIIKEDPLISIFKMRKILKHKKFGNEKIGLFKLYRLLKQYNLETKTKRYRFYRSL